MPDRKRSLEMAKASYDSKKIQKSLRAAQKAAQKRNPQKSLKSQALDQSTERGDLTSEQRRNIRNKSLHKFLTEKRKGGEDAAGRATARQAGYAALQGSATAGMNELETTQALRKSATKKKEDSPTPFKMVAASKEYDSPTVFSNKDQSIMGAFNYGVAADSPASYGTDPDKDKVGPDGMTDYARRRKAKQEEARKKIERLQEQHENRETTSSGGRAKSFTFGPIRGRDTYGG